MHTESLLAERSEADDIDQERDTYHKDPGSDMRLNRAMRRRLTAEHGGRTSNEPRVSVARKVPLHECKRRVRSNG